MCPPVPPAAISNRIVPRPSFYGLARDRQEDTDGGEADDQRRSAGGDEWQRDPRDRDDRDYHADVDERLDTQPGRDACRKQRPECVRRRQRGSNALVRDHKEQDDDEAGADEPELLADDREDEIV